jgi:hypothetical protein
MFWRSTVLPVRGGDTIKARWHLPSGADVDPPPRYFLVGSNPKMLNFFIGILRQSKGLRSEESRKVSSFAASDELMHVTRS